ncbi:MAG TPA: efflux RND transporter periplasmic adaptor subunit [Gemmatimonadaceae bacterium]|nr:efflux RND transporter periplasmic adaptor subunit [Gemmatimonadaceae bacterium]
MSITGGSISVRHQLFRMLLRGPLTLAVTLATLAACSASSDKTAEKTKDASASGKAEQADTGAMKGMAGMAMPSTAAAPDSGAAPGAQVTLSAGQIRHGGVAWQPVTMGASAAVVSVPGQLVPNEDRTARLGSPAPGRVVGVRVRPGDRVTRGQVLATLQSPEAGAAQSDYAKAQAALTSQRAQATYAKTARARAERLLALKAIPRQDYERAVADDELAQSAVAQAEAELTRARSSAEQLGAVASANGEVALQSPLAGVVLARTAAPGTVVDAGAPLVVVTDPATLWLTINAPEALAGAFRSGAMLSFNVPAYASELFTARIDAVGAGLDPGTRTLPVRATVDNRNGRLKPEMLATVMAAGGPQVPAAIVPDAAVQMLKGRTVVFIARPSPNGGATFTRRDVEVGSRTGGRAAILRGLAAGDVVVTTGAFAVKAELEKGSMPKMEM